jgi:hypothetical protein
MQSELDAKFREFRDGGENGFDPLDLGVTMVRTSEHRDEGVQVLLFAILLVPRIGHGRSKEQQESLSRNWSVR